jgi:2-aminobenzoate-CoA ligase
MSSPTAHIDTFVRDHLPPKEAWPELRFELPELRCPERLNAVKALLDDAVAEGHGNRVALYGETEQVSYRELLDRVDRIAHVLTNDLGMQTGSRVLLRSANNPMLAAAWLAVLKAGGIAVTTMSMLRAGELGKIAGKGEIDYAICDYRLTEELEGAARSTGRLGRRVSFGSGELERMMERHDRPFAACDTASEDVALLGFTSGTTGQPKATVHFHRDVLVMADIVGRHLLDTSPDDVYAGSPPLGFTFGLGALLVFPLRFRAASALVESPSPENLLRAVVRHRATCLFTAPVAYRSLLGQIRSYDISSLRRCVSAGDTLPKATSDAWREATGIRIIDGIGSTEMLHIFISAREAEARPGAAGRPLPGYEACILDQDGRPLPLGSTGRLAVRGPTGCRYLDDPVRQSEYVQNGWNITGDIFRVDEDGYYWFQCRVDDIILSAGYNISGPEVESALLQHEAVGECAVVPTPDEERGNVVKAFIVLRGSFEPSPELAKALQEFVKRTIAPYKYPRVVEFVAELPKTQSGKIRRFLLRGRAGEKL